MTSFQHYLSLETLTTVAKSHQRQRVNESQMSWSGSKKCYLEKNFVSTVNSGLCQSIVLEEIRKKIKPNSKVIIAGFTDKIGEEEYNKDLALRRCLETKKFLGVPDSQIILNPVGSEYLLYDNSTPQGRSYCRTVQITIETPIR